MFYFEKNGKCHRSEASRRVDNAESYRMALIDWRVSEPGALLKHFQEPKLIRILRSLALFVITVLGCKVDARQLSRTVWLE